MIDANSPTYLDALRRFNATQFVIRQGNKYKVRPYPLKGSIVALVGGAE